MQTIRSLALLLSLLLAGGCGAALDILAGVARGASYLGSALDVAEQGSELFFDKHPSLDAESDVNRALLSARSAQNALDGAVATAKAVDDGDLTAARSEAARTYRELEALLVSLGIPQGESPSGGAESDGPAVEAFSLPSGDDMSARL